ncbi:MAG: peptide-methionine (S)-S-oxide reductase MsrA [Phycisphaerales bacterium]
MMNRLCVSACLFGLLVGGARCSPPAGAVSAGAPKQVPADGPATRTAANSGASSQTSMEKSVAAATTKSVDANVQVQTATFGAGCFWGVEAKFRKMPGVVDTAVGYCGGQKDKPTYKEVCTDGTGHAEVVQVKFDPKVVSYQQLLDAFFKLHDPTQVNRQGPDYGRQYRTVIFAHSPEQKAEAEATIKQLEASGKFSKKIATQVVPEAPFWKAEEYHQRYLEKNGLDNCHL